MAKMMKLMTRMVGMGGQQASYDVFSHALTLLPFADLYHINRL